MTYHLGYRFVKLSVFFKDVQLPTGPWHFRQRKAEKHPETWHTAQDLTRSLAQRSSVARPQNLAVLGIQI
jgi:hypothetical protein